MESPANPTETLACGMARACGDCWLFQGGRCRLEAELAALMPRVPQGQVSLEVAVA